VVELDSEVEVEEELSLPDSKTNFVLKSIPLLASYFQTLMYTWFKSTMQ
jgi:hypothetical protein